MEYLQPLHCGKLYPTISLQAVFFCNAFTGNKMCGKSFNLMPYPHVLWKIKHIGLFWLCIWITDLENNSKANKFNQFRSPLIFKLFQSEESGSFCAWGVIIVFLHFIYTASSETAVQQMTIWYHVYGYQVLHWRNKISVQPFVYLKIRWIFTYNFIQNTSPQVNQCALGTAPKWQNRINVQNLFETIWSHCRLQTNEPN